MQNRLNWMTTFALVLLTACVLYQGWEVGRLRVELGNFESAMGQYMKQDIQSDKAAVEFGLSVVAKLEELEK